MFEVGEDIMNNITVDGVWYPNYVQTIDKREKKWNRKTNIRFDIPRGSDILSVPLVT